jgi:hypothetical protein
VDALVERFPQEGFPFNEILTLFAKANALLRENLERERVWEAAR